MFSMFSSAFLVQSRYYRLVFPSLSLPTVYHSIVGLWMSHNNHMINITLTSCCSWHMYASCPAHVLWHIVQSLQHPETYYSSSILVYAHAWVLFSSPWSPQHIITHSYQYVKKCIWSSGLNQFWTSSEPSRTSSGSGSGSGKMGSELNWTELYQPYCE